MNLWASSCSACLAELREWTHRADELRAAGVHVVAISVDGLDRDEVARSASSEKVLERIGFPFESGTATANTVEMLQMVQDHLFDAHRPLPVPSSFLLDPQGNLAATYKGRIDLDQLLGDVRQLRSSSGNRSQLFPGRWHLQRKVRNPFELIWKMVERGFLDESLEYIERHGSLLARHLEYHKLLVLAGNGELARGQARQAVTLYRKALKNVPDYVDAQNNLAWVLATDANDQIRNGHEALRLAASVVKTAGQTPSFLDTLAAAYAEVGRFPEAVATANKAIRIAASQGETRQARKIKSRLKFYESAKPWRAN